MSPSDSAPAPVARPPADVLLVEDNYLIALDTEEMLREIGVADVRTAGSVEEALSMIAAKAPDFCLLDVNLGETKSFAVADRLAELGVKFAFATGYGDNAAIPDHLACQIVSKPFTVQTLRQAFALTPEPEAG
jgi:DNA-binding NtrC family response regulator